MPAHRLGPHVVGRRIVVRRLVPGERGPTGGPAFTDLLGVCTAWGDEALVVQPEAGGPVTVPLGEIVSGKPVPPRASVRMRVSPADAERHTALLFGTVEVVEVAGWDVRWEPHPAPGDRLRKRANSCLAMTEPDRPVPAALAAVAGFYRARDREAYVQVEVGSGLEQAVAAAGWTPVTAGDAAHLLTSVALLRRRLEPFPDGVEVAADGSRVRVTVPGRAVGEAALSGDWLGVHGLHVDPAQRRRGLARTVMAALLGWGAERGARTVWLHVEPDNAPALALYDSLGFAEHHRCRYYAAP